MSLEFANRICPSCKNPNYMVLLRDFSKAYKYKCMNCNGYFNDIDFEKEPLQPVWKRECITGKDLIDYIKSNNLENAKVVLIDPDSFWCSETFDATEIEYDEKKNTILIS